ncbi:hypothetical protein [Rugamonas sp.]|uniref:hypothetical protein n=1 Tax=Rugamonas sp. TaxID=1926287 RepID=UPI0025DDD3F5|nr:hypothetical protein [Rugamonas sp.]
MNRQQLRSILSQTKVGAEVNSQAHGLATRSTLNLQMRVRIALCLVKRGLCVYPLLDLQEIGRQASMNGAEMAANMAGTSHDAQATACLCFVDAMVHSAPVLDVGQYCAMIAAGFSQEQIIEVITLTYGHLLLSRLCALIIEQDETVNCIPSACTSASLA